MNRIAQAIESLLDRGGEDTCDVFLCSNNGKHEHVFSIKENHFQREYCESHFGQMTGVEP